MATDTESDQVLFNGGLPFAIRQSTALSENSSVSRQHLSTRVGWLQQAEQRTPLMAHISFVPEPMARNRGIPMIGEEFIQFLEIGSIAVLLVILLQSIH
jgi:hypothetical protein